MINEYDSTFTSLSIESKDITLSIAKLKAKRTACSSQVPSFIYKGIQEHLLPPLLHIFSLCLASGIYPSSWKETRVVPLHKGGDLKPCNFRPISILKTPAKIFDCILHKYLQSHVLPALPSAQHRFVPGKSVTTNLISLTEFTMDAYEHCGQVDVIYFDLSKAFDTVNHGILLKKLSYFGIQGKIKSLIDSYISNRSCKVSIDNYFSDVYQPDCGVPQGSALGPLLFNIYSFDLPSSIKYSIILMYADDTKLAMQIKSISDSKALQRDINRFEDWCSTNGLKINNKKCAFISYTNKRDVVYYNYTVHGHHLTRSFSTRDLGVILDSKLTFNDQIENVKTKGLRTLGAILRNNVGFICPDTFMHLFQTLVLPVMMYCSELWNGCTQQQTENLEKVRRIFLRYMGRKFPTYKLPPVLTLADQRLKADMKFLQKIISGEVNENFISKLYFYIPSRHCRLTTMKFKPPLKRKLHSQRSPLYRIQESFNENGSSINLFKTRHTFNTV